MIRKYLAVLLCNEEMHVKVGQVDPCHPISPAKDLSQGVGALHVEVLVLRVGIDRPEVGASPQLVGPLLRDREEC